MFLLFFICVPICLSLSMSLFVCRSFGVSVSRSVCRSVCRPVGLFLSVGRVVTWVRPVGFIRSGAFGRSVGPVRPSVRPSGLAHLVRCIYLRTSNWVRRVKSSCPVRSGRGRVCPFMSVWSGLLRPVRFIRTIGPTDQECMIGSLWPGRASADYRIFELRGSNEK